MLHFQILASFIYLLHITAAFNNSTIAPTTPTVWPNITASDNSTDLDWSVWDDTNTTNLTKAGRNETAFDLIAKANNLSELPVHEFDMRFPNPKLNMAFANGSIQHAPISDRSSLWPNGVVPYVFDAYIRRRNWFIKLILGAIAEWEAKTCIRFRPKDSYDIDYVEIQYAYGCNSDVGMTGGRQIVSLGKGCLHHSVVVHELGHVVGFWHEQNRPDRDKYIRIHKKNIIPKYMYAFKKYSTYKIDSLGVPYDYKSIMHYGKTAFSNSLKITIESLDKRVKEFGNTNLSRLDVIQANLLYRCPDRSKMYPSFPEDFRLSTRRYSRHHCITLHQRYRDRRRSTNYLCVKSGKRKVDIQWSTRGPRTGMVCTKVTYYRGSDNYICVPKKSPYRFIWSVAGRIAGFKCMHWDTNSATNYKRNNYLCARENNKPVDGAWSPWSMWSQCSVKCGRGYQKRKRECSNPSPKNGGHHCAGDSYETRNCNDHICQDLPNWPDDFTYKYLSVTPYSTKCIRTYNRAQYFVWTNYYFCSRPDRRDINMKWSDNGPIRNMRCVAITEPEEAANSGWDKTYLCVPLSSLYYFKWSHSGPIPGLKCVHWYGNNGKNGWNNNYLCGKAFKPTKNVRPRIDGRWSRWGAWSGCSKTCGYGFEVRQRLCNNPAPANGGLPCKGVREDRRSCRIQDCPKVCGKALTGYRGTFRSPKMHIKHTSCTWTISVQVGNTINLLFKYFYLGGTGVDCNTNYVEIRDGRQSTAPILRTFCASRRPTSAIWSSSNTMLIRLVTSNNIREPGLSATWESSPIPTRGPSQVCGGTLTGDHGDIRSPMKPSTRRYPRNTDCVWSIRVGIHKTLKLRFLKFDVEYEASCEYDYVEVRDGSSQRSPLLGKYCGKVLPNIVTAFTNTLWVRFHSDGSSTMPGFQAVYYTEKRETPPKKCKKKWSHYASTSGNEYCYLLRKSRRTWERARQDCVKRKSNLVSIADSAEGWFIRNELLARVNYFEVWIGMNDRNKEGSWSWSDRTPVVYANWVGGDPNNGGRRKNEDCAVLRPDGGWNDFPCKKRFMYICKRKLD